MSSAATPYRIVVPLSTISLYPRPLLLEAVLGPSLVASVPVELVVCVVSPPPAPWVFTGHSITYSVNLVDGQLIDDVRFVYIESSCAASPILRYGSVLSLLPSAVFTTGG